MSQNRTEEFKRRQRWIGDKVELPSLVMHLTSEEYQHKILFDDHEEDEDIDS
jgi:hypothetical protein